MPEQINGLNIPSLQNKRPIYFKQNKQEETTAEANNPETAALEEVNKKESSTEIKNKAAEANPLNNSDMGQSPYTLPVAAGVWYGMAQGMDKFGKACDTPTYESSVLGKITGAADKLSDKVTNSSVGKSSFATWVGNKYDSVAKYMDKVTSNPKNRLLYSLRNHRTKPECKMVIGPAGGQNGTLEMDTKQIFEEFLKPGKQAAELNQYGIDKATIAQIEKLSTDAKQARIQELEFNYFNEPISQVEANINKLSKTEKINKTKQLLSDLKGGPLSSKEIKELASKTESELAFQLKELHLKELKITKGLGFKSVTEFGKIVSDESYAIEHMDDTLKALKNGDRKLKIVIWNKDGKLGKAYTHLFGRVVGINELINKYETSLKTGAKTKFGKMVGKSFAFFTEGTTNRFSGGKLAVAMQAMIFADMIINTIHAPKGEKGKTFIERFVNDFSYFLAMPLGIWAMHKAGGLKYLGMTEAQRNNYRANLKKFNFDVKNNAYTKKQYKLRSKVLDRQLMAGVKNPIYRLLKKAAKILTIGLEQKAAYISKDAKNLNLLRKIGFQAKNIAGYPIRFIIPMFILSPFIAKIATKGSDAIFGKPTKSVLDEDKEPEKADEHSNTQATTSTQKQNTINPNDIKSDTNLIKQAAMEANNSQSTSRENSIEKNSETGENNTENSNKGNNNENKTQELNSNQNNGNTSIDNSSSTTKNTDKRTENSKEEKNNINNNTPNNEITKNSEENSNSSSTNPEQGGKSTTTTTTTTTETTTSNDKDNNSNKEMEPLRTYIPSPIGKVKKTSPDTSALNSALAEADAAEKYIQSILAENSK